MKIDRSKWQDEDWDMEDDLPEKRLTHREKVVRDAKKASIQKKRKEKMRMREEEKTIYTPQVKECEAKDPDYYDAYPDEYDTWEEYLDW